MSNALKIPRVDAGFWVTKVLATALGETSADFFSEKLGFELSSTTLFFSGALVALLAVEILLSRLIVPLYWACVSVMGVAATLLTDTLTDGHHVPLWISTVWISVGLAALFAIWYALEGTVSYRSITTHRREVLYWAVVLGCFALGTAAGDLVSEALGLGFVQSMLLFAAVFLVIGLMVRLSVIAAPLAFWLAYILPTPLGTNVADTLTQTREAGGLGFNSGVTSAVLIGAIILLIIGSSRHTDKADDRSLVTA